MKSRVSLMVAVALGAGFSLMTPATAAACSTSEALDYITPTTLHVVIKPFHKRYARGDTVVAKVVVTRPAEEDPAGLGIPMEPPASQPAADVNVGVGISVRGAFLAGYGKTNDEGEVAVAVKLGNQVPAGSATVRAYAYKERLNNPCVVVEEQGYRTKSKAFSVTSDNS
jgi:hypothetical protein